MHEFVSVWCCIHWEVKISSGWKFCKQDINLFMYCMYFLHMNGDEITALFYAVAISFLETKKNWTNEHYVVYSHVCLTLHWQMEHSVACLFQLEPLKRVTPCSSTQVLVTSLYKVSAWHGSEMQRGQHSPSGTATNSQSVNGAQGMGQQSTSPCCSKRYMHLC